MTKAENSEGGFYDDIIGYGRVLFEDDDAGGFFEYHGIEAEF